MKHLFLILLLFMIAGFSAGAQPSAWTFALPATAVNGVMDVATDAAGNAYVTGTFTGSIKLGTTTISSTRPGVCVYIAKISPAGQVLRVTKLEGATEAFINAITVDATGNTFITGSFFGTLTYNGGQQTTGRLPLPGDFGGYNILLVKCGTNGRVRWVQQADGGTAGIYGNSYGADVTVDRAGNSYICGRINGSDIQFGTLFYGAHRNQGFLASYNRQGQLRWAKVLAALPPGFGISPAGGVALDNAGHCYLSGYSIRGWALDGTIVLCPETNSNNLYLAKLDAQNGHLEWAQCTPGEGNGTALATDKIGDVYLGGSFTGTKIFGNYTLTSADDADGFVARYDPDGTVDWAMAIGGPKYDAVNAIAVDQKSRKVFATGLMNFTPAGTNQTFLATLSANGRRQHTELVGGPGTSSGGNLALDNNNNVYSTGIFTGSCTFGALSRSNISTQSYLARYGSHLRGNGEYDDHFRPPALDLFPNPAQNQLTLRLDTQAPAGQATLFNHLGTPVASQPIGPTTAEVHFDTSPLPDGLYALRVATQGKTTTQQVVVQH